LPADSFAENISVEVDSDQLADTSFGAIVITSRPNHYRDAVLLWYFFLRATMVTSMR
jgi:hypothetical protein